MFAGTVAMSAAETAKRALRDSLIAAIEADAKSLWQVAQDARMVYSDLVQFLGGSTEPYLKAQRTVSLELAAQIASGLTDRALDIRVGDATPATITTTTLPAGQEGVSYGSQTVVTTGGAAPLAFSLKGGTALPTSLLLNATTGVVSGTPTVAGTYTPTIRVVDANGYVDEQAYSIVIAPA